MKYFPKVGKRPDLELLKAVHNAHDSYIISILPFNLYFKNEDQFSRIYKQLRGCIQMSTTR